MTSHYTPLEQESLLHISGPDTLTFLQGQTTCDTRQVNEDSAVQGAYCTPQGRVVCDFLLCQAGEEEYLLRLRHDVRARAAATFGKYIIFSKAQLSEADDWQLLGCWGPDAGEILGGLFGTVPTEQYGARRGDGYVLVQVDAAGQQFECYFRGDAGTGLLTQLCDTMQASDENTWQALQIQSGIGRIEAATVEEFIPQMLNYDLTGHINFKKGCYTGQEVVARMHYRGKPKRRMHLATLASTSAPAAGQPLYSGGTSQSVGNIVNAALTADGRALILVVATAAGVEDGLHLGAMDGPRISVEELPYDLHTD